MQITINDSEWEIFEANTHSPTLYHLEDRCRGITRFPEQKIYLDRNLKYDTKYSVLCHELSHAFLYETQIQNAETFDEEMLCEFVGIYGKKIVQIADNYFDDYKPAFIQD